MYRPGLYACLATAVANLVIVGVLTAHAYVENKKADRGEKELETDEVSDILLVKRPWLTILCRRTISLDSGIPTNCVRDFFGWCC
jgi:hypothetical protein